MADQFGNTDLARAAAKIIRDLDWTHDHERKFMVDRGIAVGNLGASARGEHLTVRPMLALADTGISTLPEAEAVLAEWGRTRNDLIHSAVVWEAWEQLRAVYAMHPALTEYLGEMDSDRIPTAVLNQIPHDHPLIVFTDPIVLDTGDRGLGFMVYGIAADDTEAHGYRHCGIHDPARIEIGLHFYYQAPDSPKAASFEPGTPSAPISTVTMVIDGRPGATMAVEDGAIPANSRIRGALTGINRTEPVDQRTRGLVEKLARHAIASLLYLTQADPDIEVGDRKIRREANRDNGTVRRSPQRNNAATAFQVGWRLGPTLPRVGTSRLPRDRSTAVGNGEGHSGRTLAPHVRGPHTRIGWVGRGRKTPVTQFIAMTTVNKHRIGADGVEQTTVLPVRPTRKVMAGQELDLAHDTGPVADADIDAFDAINTGKSPTTSPAKPGGPVAGPATNVVVAQAYSADSTIELGNAEDLAGGIGANG